MNQQIEKVNQYYEASIFDYHSIWTSKKDLAIHFGYYDHGVTSHSDSLLKMNEILARHVEITDKDEVLDAGCGYGGSSIWLAKNIGCKVTGLNIVPFQINRARQFVQKQGLEDLVSFRKEDFARTSFPDASFDVVWGLESIVHAQNKLEVMTEFSRLLRPNGRLVIAEYTLREVPPLSKQEHDFIQPWLEGWTMPSLCTVSEYKKLLEISGFANIEKHDVTPNVMPSLKRLEHWLYLGLPIGRLFHILGIFSKTHLDNIEGVKTQMVSLKKGYWHYTILTARKKKKSSNEEHLHAA